MIPKKRYAYLEFSINSIILGNVYFELFPEPEIQKSVENFLALCRGKKYHSIYTGEVLTYKHCKIEKIKKNKCIKCGDLQNKTDKESPNRVNNIYNGIRTVGKYNDVECIYGKSYDKEYSTRKHTDAGLLTMIQVEDNKLSSIFKITLHAVPSYNNKNTIIGRVIKNMHILRAIELLPVYSRNKEPRVNVYISDCNEIKESFFKKEKISSRRQYIDRLFKQATRKYRSLNAKQKEEDGEEEEDIEEEETEIKEGYVENKKKDKQRITEKKKGEELLNKILTTVDALCREKKHKKKISKKTENKDTPEKKNIEPEITKEENLVIDEEEEENNNKSIQVEEEDNDDDAEEEEDNDDDAEEEEEDNDEDAEEEEEEEKEDNDVDEKPMSEFAKKMMDVNLKINQALKLNLQEMDKPMKCELFDIESVLNDDYDTITNNELTSNKEENRKVQKQVQPPYEDNQLYFTSALELEDKLKKKNKQKFSMEEDINLFKKINFQNPLNTKIYEKTKQQYGEDFYAGNLLKNDTGIVSEKYKNNVIDFYKKQEEWRSKFSRKRKHNDDEEPIKNYVNKRNQIYNKKLDRYFNKYTSEIRRNLENNK